MAISNGKTSQNFLIDNLLQGRRRHAKSSDGDSSTSSEPPTPPTSPLLHPLSLVTFPAAAAAHYAPHTPVLMSPFLPRSGFPYPVLFAAAPPPPPLQYHQPRPVHGGVPQVAVEVAADQTLRSISDDEHEESDDSTSETAENLDKTGGGTSPADKEGFRKKKRTAFTTAQLQEMEKKFEEQKYLTKGDRTRLAKKLGLTEKHVKTWYQNRRTKWKRGTTEFEWSKERERSATAMYQQFVSEKNRITSPHHTVFHT